MYTPTLALFAFFSLILPILAVPVPEPIDINRLEKRTTFNGEATWYHTDGVAGSCGKINSDDQRVVAISTQFLGYSALCGKEVSITSGGKSVKAVIEDSCPSCGEYHIDLSPAAFKELAPLSKGEIDVEWHII